MRRTLQHPILFPLAAVLLILALGAAGPIPQPPDYHGFADQRTLFGIERAVDVLSNLGFLLVGAWGLLRLRRARPEAARSAWAAFFAALVLTAFGSAFYHLAPDDFRLVWDRIPIALACAALLAVAAVEAAPGRKWSSALLPLLSAAGVLSVLWWFQSGDLRYYLLIQAASLVLVPLLQWQAGAEAATRRAFGAAIGLYILAKLCELNDAAILEAIGVLSGHTLKHLLATAAAFLLASDFARRTP